MEKDAIAVTCPSCTKLLEPQAIGTESGDTKQQGTEPRVETKAEDTKEPVTKGMCSNKPIKMDDTGKHIELIAAGECSIVMVGAATEQEDQSVFTCGTNLMGYGCIWTPRQVKLGDEIEGRLQKITKVAVAAQYAAMIVDLKKKDDNGKSENA